jgi:hypothetical protein
MPRLLTALSASLATFLAVSAAARAAEERRATIFYTGAVQGALEPCGCTSDPLGDVARMTDLVRRAVKAAPKGVLVVDAGNLSYPLGSVSPKRREGMELRAAFLARELGRLPFGGSALGESDLGAGPERVTPPRLAANVSGPRFLEAGKVRDVGGIRIGLLGVADPALARASGWTAEDPALAAQREADRLRKAGAEVLIALAALDRNRARQIARAGGVDFVIIGKDVGDDGLARADAVGQAFILAPGQDLQRVGRLEIVLRGPAAGGRVALVDAGGAEALAQERAGLEHTLTRLESDLARWEKAGGADAAFVAARKKERDEVKLKLASVAAQAWQPPASGSYFTNQLIPLRRALPRDPQIATAMRQLDKVVGQANLRVAEPPPKAPPARASFAGDRTCVGCHKREAAFWKTTVHAHAWKTLVDGGKTGHDDCVSCHVTGYGEIGGSSLGFVQGLTAVQCEVCHGPGSLHVKAEGLEEPPAVRKDTPETTCTRCHNEKHSDTFNFTAYLRDILGPGHGEEARKKLGDGPTGGQLRKAAMAKAKAAGAAQVKKL